MKQGMNIKDMIREVQRQTDSKRDFLGRTGENLQMVSMPNAGFAHDLAIVVSVPESPTLERFEITENCHRQIAARLKIPLKYYFRMLDDNRELIIDNVNSWFEKEPENRMVRTLDGKARAFLSDRYKRIDNAPFLADVLPVIEEYPTAVLSSYVDDNRMYLKMLFTGDEHKINVGHTKTGAPEILRPGFIAGNSETGHGKRYFRGFVYRDFCYNGCVWGTENVFKLETPHLGPKLDVPESLILSDETRRKADELAVDATRDALTYLASPENMEAIGTRVAAVRQTKEVGHAETAVAHVAGELGLNDDERSSVLESFIKDRDYTQWGMVNAVTQVANDTDDYNRASEIEGFGNKLMTLSLREWNQIAELEKVAA